MKCWRHGHIQAKLWQKLMTDECLLLWIPLLFDCLKINFYFKSIYSFTEKVNAPEINNCPPTSSFGHVISLEVFSALPFAESMNPQVLTSSQLLCCWFPNLVMRPVGSSKLKQKMLKWEAMTDTVAVDLHTQYVKHFFQYIKNVFKKYTLGKRFVSTYKTFLQYAGRVCYSRVLFLSTVWPNWHVMTDGIFSDAATEALLLRRLFSMLKGCVTTARKAVVSWQSISTKLTQVKCPKHEAARVPRTKGKKKSGRFCRSFGNHPESYQDYSRLLCDCAGHATGLPGCKPLPVRQRQPKK